MVNIRQMLVSKDKYNIKCPYIMNPIGITVHNTANDSSANNEVSYMRTNNNEVSFHYAVDNIEIVQGIPEDRNAWHAGDGGSGQGNRNYISIEICYSQSGGEKFDKAEENAADLIVKILKERGWGIDKIKKHQDFSGKYCPHRTLDMGWQRFLDKVQAKYNNTNNEGVNRSMYIFSKNWYLKKNSDVAKNEMYKDDPYLHYEKYGKNENRKPLPPIPVEYCEGDYLELNQDVKGAVAKGTYTSGLHHYLDYGFCENRKINKGETDAAVKKRVEELELKLEQIKSIVG